jgi:hypothetical protein
MEMKKAQKVVRIVAIIILALSIWALVQGVLYLMALAYVTTGCAGNIYCNIIAFMPAFYIAFFILGITTSIGLWHYKNWARILLIISIVVVMLSFFVISMAHQRYEAYIVALAASSGSEVVTINMNFPTTPYTILYDYIARYAKLAVALFVIYLFTFNKSIKQVFAAQKPMKAKKTKKS